MSCNLELVALSEAHFCIFKARVVILLYLPQGEFSMIIYNRLTFEVTDIFLESINLDAA